MGFLDKLLGRSKQAVDQAADVAKDVAEKAADMAEGAVDRVRGSDEEAGSTPPAGGADSTDEPPAESPRT